MRFIDLYFVAFFLMVFYVIFEIRDDVRELRKHPPETVICELVDGSHTCALLSPSQGSLALR